MSNEQNQSDAKAHPVDTLVMLACPFCGDSPSCRVAGDSHNWIGGWIQDIKIECCIEMTESFGSFQGKRVSENEAKYTLITRWNTRAI